MQNKLEAAFGWIDRALNIVDPSTRWCFPTEMGQDYPDGRKLTPKEQALYDASLELIQRTLMGGIEVDEVAKLKLEHERQERTEKAQLELAIERLKSTVILRKARYEARARA